MIVAQHQVGPDRSIEMALDLQPQGGIVMVYLRGTTRVRCKVCGGEHEVEVQAELGCGPDMHPRNLDDMEWAIRGNEEAADRLGTRMLKLVIAKVSPPCYGWQASS